MTLIHWDWPEYTQEYHARKSKESRSRVLWRLAEALPLNFIVSVAALLVLIAIDLEAVYPLSWRIVRSCSVGVNRPQDSLNNPTPPHPRNTFQSGIS